MFDLAVAQGGSNALVKKNEEIGSTYKSQGQFGITCLSNCGFFTTQWNPLVT